MRAFYRFFRRLHRWLIANLLLLGAFCLARERRAVMNAVSSRFSMPIQRALGAFWSHVPFSAAELCYVIAIVGLFAYLVASAFAIRRAEYRADALYARGLGLVNMVLSIYAVFCLLWGVNYYADDFCDKSGIVPEPVAAEDLAALTRVFAEQTAACADEVARDGNGLFAVPRSEILGCAPSLYEPVYEEFPFLKLPCDYVPKTIFFSKIMSAMNVTGLYFPFTGEANVNIDFPGDTLPSTVAHELAHRRGIASEQQCNFIAILVSTRSENAAYRYSGYLTGYIHLANALARVDPESWREIRALLPETVIADLNNTSDYWASYRGVTARVSGKAYDTMLKSYGDTLGMQSYGAVVDLLVAYYRYYRPAQTGTVAA